MSLLIRDSLLAFSPELAATIGLEEAILLQTLVDISQYQQQSPFSVAVERLQERMNFWSLDDLQRVCKSLADKGIVDIQSPPLAQTDKLLFAFESQAEPAETIANKTAGLDHRGLGANRISPLWQPDETVLQQIQQHNIPIKFARDMIGEFVTYWKDRGEISHSWNAKFLKHVIRQWRQQQADPVFIGDQKPREMAKGWEPSSDAMDILRLNGINEQFIEDAIPEFVLYWRERGDATNTWNSKFIQHVKRQWARFSSTLKYDSEPRRIPANWQPDNEVFDILHMANIDTTFAEELIPEFVLYWKDSNKLHSSWNIKFLQHVKNSWARQHQLQGTHHEGQRSTTVTNPGFIDKHTDRSWADGI